MGYVIVLKVTVLEERQTDCFEHSKMTSSHYTGMRGCIQIIRGGGTLFLG